MSLPQNVFAPLDLMSPFLEPEELLEMRFENNGDNNPIFIGYSPIPNANPADAVWYIQKITYSGQAIIRKQLPDDGPKWAYVWDDRDTYFT